MSVRAIVLAAGKGTRMKSDLAKVLYPVAGRPMLMWTLDALDEAQCEQTVVVVGHQADAVRAVLPEGVDSVLQGEQLGTGHAAMVGLGALDVDAMDNVLVMPGDMPLVRAETLAELLLVHRERDAAATLLSVVLDEPQGYGRILRSGDRVLGVVEERDATPQQRAIAEVNTSVYVFSGRWLAGALDRITTDNVQQEYYLTDVVGILVGDGHTVAAHPASPEEGLGINSVDQIEGVEQALRLRNTDVAG